MGCLNVNISLKGDTISPAITDVGRHLRVRCSIVCDATSLEQGDSFTWSDGVRLLWDNGGLILIDK